MIRTDIKSSERILWIMWRKKRMHLSHMWKIISLLKAIMIKKTNSSLTHNITTDYISEMRNGKWGGYIEIQACSSLYKCNIYVHRLGQPPTVFENPSATRSVHLSYPFLST
jgi:hypothetical protein